MLDREKGRLEQVERDLVHEREDLASHLKNVILSDAGIVQIEQFCAEIREGLDAAILEDKRRYFDLLDVRTD